MVERVRILYVDCLAGPAVREVQLVVIRDAVEQIPGPLETQTRVFMQQEVGLERAAYPMPEFNVGPRPTGGDIVSGVYAQQQAAAKKCDECCCLQLIVRILDEAGHLSR